MNLIFLFFALPNIEHNAVFVLINLVHHEDVVAADNAKVMLLQRRKRK